jgi:hypothetical protein
MQTAVCNIQLAPEFKHDEGLLIDGRLWYTVSDYVAAGGDFHKGMLAKFCQHIHLQPLLTAQLNFQKQQQLPSTVLSTCFTWLYEQLCPRSPQGVIELVHCMATCNAQVQNNTLIFFHRCLPFSGLSQAVVMTNMYCQRLVNGYAYPEGWDQTMRSFEPHQPHQAS